MQILNLFIYFLFVFTPREIKARPVRSDLKTRMSCDREKVLFAFVNLKMLLPTGTLGRLFHWKVITSGAAFNITLRGIYEWNRVFCYRQVEASCYLPQCFCCQASRISDSCFEFPYLRNMKSWLPINFIHANASRASGWNWKQFCATLKALFPE